MWSNYQTMLVTINTDASFYPLQKIGGYAIWIASNKGRVKHADGFKGNVETPHDAEFKAVINALHLLKKQNWEITEIYINTDSQTVIDTVETKGTFKNLPQYGKDNYKAYQSIIQQLGVKDVSLRHVKAHLHTNTARHWVNEWLDTEAKKAARKILKDKFGILVR